MKKQFLNIELLIFIFVILFSNNQLIISQTPTEIKGKVDLLIKKMTLKEKVGRLNLETFVNENDSKNDLTDKIERVDVGSILKSNGAKNNLRLQKIAVEQTRLGIPIIFEEDVSNGQNIMSYFVPKLFNTNDKRSLRF